MHMVDVEPEPQKTQKVEVKAEQPAKLELKRNTDMGTYLAIIVIVALIGGGLYFYKYQQKLEREGEKNINNQ